MCLGTRQQSNPVSQRISTKICQLLSHLFGKYESRAFYPVIILPFYSPIFISTFYGISIYILVRQCLPFSFGQCLAFSAAWHSEHTAISLYSYYTARVFLLSTLKWKKNSAWNTAWVPRIMLRLNLGPKMHAPVDYFKCFNSSKASLQNLRVR